MKEIEKDEDGLMRESVEFVYKDNPAIRDMKKRIARIKKEQMKKEEEKNISPKPERSKFVEMSDGLLYPSAEIREQRQAQKSVPKLNRKERRKREALARKQKKKKVKKSA